MAALATLCALLLAAEAPAATPGAAAVDGARLAKLDHEPGQWLSHGRGNAERRYSPLRQINTRSVQPLGLPWFADLEPTRARKPRRWSSTA